MNANDSSMPGSAATTNAIADDILCQSCGYNLRALTGQRCPECGESLELIRQRISRLPWTHRERLGWFRAYWATVILAMFKQKQFCSEMARPVSYSDSQSFRWLTIAFACAPFIVATILAFCTPAIQSALSTDLNFANGEFWPALGVVAFLALFLAAATGIPSYFFHPRDVPVTIQNRAIALSYYACSALAWMFIPLGFAVAAAFFHKKLVGGGLLLFALGLAWVLAVNWWLDLARLMGRMLPGRRLRIAAMSVSVPLLWLAALAAIVVALPAIIAYIVLMISSLISF